MTLIFFYVAIIFGIGLFLGGLMFLVLSGLLGLHGKLIFIFLAGVIQMAMGGLAFYAGILSKQNSPIAKWLFAFSMAIVILNALVVFSKFMSG